MVTGETKNKVERPSEGRQTKDNRERVGNGNVNE
jgi:hypothetical protein